MACKYVGQAKGRGPSFSRLVLRDEDGHAVGVDEECADARDVARDCFSQGGTLGEDCG